MVVRRDSVTSSAACPKCGAEDFRFLNVVHEAGLSAVSMQTRGTGCSPVSILLFPFIGFWSLLFSSFGQARTTGTVQSAASAKAAPPARQSIAFPVILALAGLILLPSHGPLGALLLLLGSLSGYAGWTFNRRVYPYRYQVWEQSAMCQRCGTTYLPDASRITLDAVTTGQVLGEQQRRVAAAAKPLLNRAHDLGGQVVQKVAARADERRLTARPEEANQKGQEAGTTLQAQTLPVADQEH